VGLPHNAPQSGSVAAVEAHPESRLIFRL
jgi:hypothetical protein